MLAVVNMSQGHQIQLRKSRQMYQICYRFIFCKTAKQEYGDQQKTKSSLIFHAITVILWDTNIGHFSALLIVLATSPWARRKSADSLFCHQALRCPWVVSLLYAGHIKESHWGILPILLPEKHPFITHHTRGWAEVELSFDRGLC